jgi:hypothetical protein
MQVILLVVLAVGLLYFALRMRRVDAFTVAFFSAVIYFLPGFAGFTLSPITPASPVKLPVPMTPEALGIMVFVLGSIVIGALLWDECQSIVRDPDFRLEPCASSSTIALGLALVGMVLTWLETGGAAFAADKKIVIGAVGTWHVLWEMSASIAAVLAFLRRQYIVLLSAIALLMLDVWIGFRFALALVFVACTWLWLDDGRRKRLRSVSPRHIMMILIGGLVIISYQNLKDPVRRADWNEVGHRLSSPLWYVRGVMTSEPFTTQTVLNEVVRRNFHTDMDHIWSTSQQLILFSTQLGAEDARFNDLYQPALFPQVDHGLANNIWAQMWSAGGWPLLVAFTLIFVSALAAGSWLVRCPDPSVKAMAGLLMVYWAFYIHRNELLVQVGFAKQIFLTWCLCTATAIVIGAAAAATRKRQDLGCDS